MKYLLTILFAVALFSCHKQEVKRMSFDRMAELFKDDMLPEEIDVMSAKGGKPGKPNPTPTPPPPVVIKDTVGTATVLLDFNGHYNTYYRFTEGYRAGIEDITTPEQRQTIMDSMAADWQNKGWGDIIFTTDEQVYQNAPTQKRMRVVFTKDYVWYPNEAGGVADPYSFEKKDAVCFVFVDPTRIPANETKWLWEVASHEFGHTLGLVHIAQWENGVMTYSYCGLHDVYPDHVHLMGVPYYGWSDVAIGRTANGNTEYPDAKVKAMLD